MGSLKPEDFSGPEGSYITITYDKAAKAWRYRPVTGGALLGDADLVALGIVAPVKPEPVEPIPSREVLPFSQRDPRWSSIPLGASRYTIGSAGCAVVAATMLATLAQPDVTPKTVVEWLNGHGGFTAPEAGKPNSGGLLYWAKVAEFVDGLRHVNYVKWEKTGADLDYVRRVLYINPQVVQVDFKPETSVLDTHFVLALEMTSDGKDINIIDPWTGLHTTLLTAYAKQTWDLARAIYALSEYEVLP